MDVYQRFSLKSIPALDGVRALAVLSVILWHLGVRFAAGIHGVMAFFVLSGFLITWLLLAENEQTGTVSLRKFYIRRALRIFPAFYVFWIVYVVLAAMVLHRTEWPSYISSLLYVSNYYAALTAPAHVAMAHTWSLAVEEQFYLIWPFLFLHFRSDLRRLTRLLVGFLICVWIYRAFLFYRLHVPPTWLGVAFETRADHLVVGCLLAVLIKRRAISPFLRAITTSPLLPVVTMALLAGSIYLGSGSETNPAYLYTVGFCVDPLLLGILIMQWIVLTPSPMWRWLDSPWMRFAGRISYPMYLYHWLIDYVLVRWVQGWPVIVSVLVGIGVSVLLATLSYYIVERPFLRLKARFSQLPKASSPLQAEIGAVSDGKLEAAR